MSISLSDLPEFVLKSIFEYSGLRSIFILRKVSHSFRNFIDDVQPCTGIQKIGVIFCWDAIALRITTSTDCYHIKYQFKEQGCSILTRKLPPLSYVSGTSIPPTPPLPAIEKSSESFQENQDYVQVFFEDFNTILALQTTLLQEFHVNLNLYEYMFPTRGRWARSTAPLPGLIFKSKDDFLQSVAKTLEQILADRPHLLKVDTLQLDVGNHSQVLQVLPYLDPKYLKTINTQNRRGFKDGGIEMQEIVKLEQFKSAEQLHLSSFVASAPIEHFSHFLNSSFLLETISCDDLKKLKEVFFNNKNFRRFKTKYNHFSGDENLLEAFGSAECGQKWFFWEFSIPGSEEALFLNVVLCYPYTVCFTRCSKYSPPQKGCVNCVYV